LINCLVFSIIENTNSLQYISTQSNTLTETLLSFIEKFNNILKVKTIILLAFLMIDPDIILKYGEEIFLKIQKFRLYKNKEVHLSVKFFEKIVSSNSPSFIKSFNALINKDKINDIIKYCKIFDITGLYHRISYSLFTTDFLDTIKKLIKKKISNKENSGELIGHLLDVLIKFSENPFSVEKNIDYILKGFLLELLQLTSQIKGDENLTKVRLICSNIFTIILTDERLYSYEKDEGTKTKEIQKLISNLMPSLKTLLQNEEISEGILSLLSLIIERDDNLISLYSKNGIIDYIFNIMQKKEYCSNLNIIKILITLVESKDIEFKDILSMGLIDKVNYLIDNSYNEESSNNENNYNDNIDENLYFDYIFELFYDIVMKILEYKKKMYPRGVKINLESYNKEFRSKIEKIGKNFNLCIKLLGNRKNVNIQEMSCVCLIFILEIFPGYKFKSFNLELRFKNDDIPNLLKGLELSCYKIHKKMISIFDWIIQFQDDAKEILKPNVGYLTTYLENIINTSAEPEVIFEAKNFIDKKISSIK